MVADAFGGWVTLRVWRIEENGLRWLAHFDARVSRRGWHVGGNRGGEGDEL